MNKTLFKNWRRAELFWDNFDKELYLKIKKLRNG